MLEVHGDTASYNLHTLFEPEIILGHTEEGEEVQLIEVQKLWGMARGRCSMCEMDLMGTSQESGEVFHLGNIAHNVGKGKDSARSETRIDPNGIDAYDNLILLCPTCHAKVDKKENRKDYPMEKMKTIKQEHEERMGHRYNSTARPTVSFATYSWLIDRAASSYKLDNFEWWVTNYVLSSGPRIPDYIDSGIVEFEMALRTSIPTEMFPNLRRSFQVLSWSGTELRGHFQQNYGTNGGPGISPIPFHKTLKRWDDREYSGLLQEWNEWQKENYRLMFFLTKSANLVLECVRECFDPLFFIDDGGRLTAEGIPYEFSQKEKDRIFSANENRLGISLISIRSKIKLVCSST